MIAQVSHDMVNDTAPIPKGRIGRFIVEHEIGQGSVGKVYLFRDPLIGRKVAIKILNPLLPADQRRTFEENFIHEARAAGRLNHPNIVTVYDADKVDNQLFIAMEYLEGKELRDLIQTGHQFTYKQIADLIARVANALDYAHRHGVIHRDIKPANIFIVGRLTPKVLDFGIARASRQLAEHDINTHDGLTNRHLLGTPSYMSPEQARSEKIDARSDIFSLGVVLYQLLCGQLPFKSDSIEALLESIAHDMPAPPQEIRPDVPLRLARIAAKALAKKPEDRYVRAADMAVDLNRFLAKERTNQIIAKLQQPEERKFSAPLPVPQSNEEKPEPQQAMQEKPIAAAIVPEPRQVSGPRYRATALIGTVLVAAAVGVAWFAYNHGSVKPEPVAAASTSPANPAVEASAAASASTETSAPVGLTASATSEPVTSTASPTATVAATTETPASNATPTLPITSATASSAKANSAVPAIQALGAAESVVTDPAEVAKLEEKAKPAKPVPTTGKVQIAVTPWGEVFVDGAAKGVSPPLSRLNLPAGTHRIEIRNGADKHVISVQVVAGKEVKVRHKF